MHHDTATRRYQAPGWLMKHLLNRIVAGLTRLGVSVWGSRVLEVRGRRSGVLRRTPVNLLSLGGATYLVAPRGETQWVRNVRAAGGHLDLVVGRRRTHVVATELEDGAKVAPLRAYLERWRFEVGAFFDGIGPDSSDGELAAVSPMYPVFTLAEQ